MPKEGRAACGRIALQILVVKDTATQADIGDESPAKVPLIKGLRALIREHFDRLGKVALNDGRTNGGNLPHTIGVFSKKNRRGVRICS